MIQRGVGGQFNAQLRKRWRAGSTVPGEPL
jgi:hypothetical protein